EPEHPREMMLPRPHVKPEILYRRGRRYGVAPGRPEPLDTTAVRRILRQGLERIDHVVRPHFAQPVQQAPRVIQHYPRPLPLPHQLRHELPDPLIAPPEDRRIV